MKKVQFDYIIMIIQKKTKVVFYIIRIQFKNNPKIRSGFKILGVGNIH